MKTVLNKMLQPAFGKLLKFLPGSGSNFSIGLDMGPDRLILVQMERLADKPSIRAIAALPYPCPRDELLRNPQRVKRLLKQAYAMQPFRGKRVVSCLPTNQIKILTIPYRHTEGEPATPAIVAELRERLKDDLDGMVVDFMTLRQEETVSGKRDALVALAPRDKVVAYLDLLTAAGLEVDALDIGPAALARLVCHAGSIHTPDFPRFPNVLLINFGSFSSFLTVIWGRRVMLDRTVEFSENRLFARLKLILEMPESLAMHLLYEADPLIENGSPDEARRTVTEVLRPEITLLLREINKTLVYMASKTRGQSFDMIYLAGRVARYPSLLNILAEQLKIPVKILNPVAVFATAGSKAIDESLGTMAGIALTTGMALRGLPEIG
jgi:type IV pilus assembly protein PilM